MRKLTTFLMFFLFSVAQVWAQNRTVTGKVTDEKGAAVAGATVKANGSTKATSTNADGSFSLSVPNSVKSLTISGIGFTQEAKIPAVGSMNVTAKITAVGDALEEVVVQVPYGTVAKSKFSGASNTVTSKQLEKQQVTSFTKALEGITPGLNFSNGAGGPGSNAEISLRGFGSLPGSGARTSPLYVVNGVVYDGPITSINSDDIESINILKDAAAASLYGARAGNGVIMITLKKGKKGKAQINLKLSQGFITRGVPEYERLDSKEYYETYWESLRNSKAYIGGTSSSLQKSGQWASENLVDNLGQGLIYNAYNVDSKNLVDPISGKLNPNAKLLWNDSWEQAMFRQASRQNINLSIGGASDRSDYIISMGYLKEQGLIRNSDFERYNFKVGANTSANSWLSTGINIDLAYTTRNDVSTSGGSSANPFYFTRNIAPIYPIWERDKTTGAFILDPVTGEKIIDYGIPDQMGNRPFNGSTNPVGIIELDKNRTTRINAIGSSYLDFKLSKSLNFKTTLGGSIADDNNTSYQNSLHGNALNVKGRSTVYSYREYSLTFNQVLSWKKTFKDEHNFDALVGHESYLYREAYLDATRIGFLFNGYTGLNNATTTEGQPSSYENDHRLEGYFGKIGYNYNNKYFIDATYRTDGSSRFANDLRWGKFYSIAGSWRLIQESFLKSVKNIDDLKLRVSYGSSGNEDIGRYYEYNEYQFANGVGDYQPSTILYNSKIKWESNINTNIGIDFAFFKRKLTGSIDVFNRESKDMLYKTPLSQSSGYEFQYQNIGRVVNKGIEVQLGYNVITKKDFDWRVDVNITSFKNEVKNLTPTIEAKGGIVDGSFKYTVGGSVYDFWTTKFAGVDASTGQALYYQNVLGSDKKATGETRLVDANSTSNNGPSFYKTGSSIPDYTGGLTNSIRYKNVELSILVAFSKGGLFSNGEYSQLMGSGSAGQNWSTDIRGRWRKPGDITNIPRIQTSLGTGGGNRFLMDRSYVNLKNITLTYSIPKQTLRKVGMNNVTLFFNIDNVALFTVKRGSDPQRSFSGINGSSNAYPLFRTITFGTNLSF